MSIMFCEKCDCTYDTDYDVDCPRCEEENEWAHDRAQDEKLIDEAIKQ